MWRVAAGYRTQAAWDVKIAPSLNLPNIRRHSLWERNPHGGAKTCVSHAKKAVQANTNRSKAREVNDGCTSIHNIEKEMVNGMASCQAGQQRVLWVTRVLVEETTYLCVSCFPYNSMYNIVRCLSHSFVSPLFCPFVICAQFSFQITFLREPFF